MKISRHGASSYHGVSEIDLSGSTIKWDSSVQELKINKSYVKDFSTDSEHNYTVGVPIEDVREMLEVLANAALENPSKFESILENSLKSLSKLQAVASGIKT